MTCFKCGGQTKAKAGTCTVSTGRLCQSCSDEVEVGERDEPADWLRASWVERYWPEHAGD